MTVCTRTCSVLSQMGFNVCNFISRPGTSELKPRATSKLVQPGDLMRTHASSQAKEGERMRRRERDEEEGEGDEEEGEGDEEEGEGDEEEEREMRRRRGR